MSVVKFEHFQRAAEEIGSHGDNDTLPFDIDTRFIKDSAGSLSKIAMAFFEELEKDGIKGAKKKIDSISVFSERLLVPTGSNGFRITTKIHPFWNLYLNGLAIAVAEVLEPRRYATAHAYRFIPDGKQIFDPTRSWKAYREATLEDRELTDEDGVTVIQTDISSFYEHIYHHRLENCLQDLLPPNSTIPCQIDRIFNQLASGRSFGLPVGGQCSRVMAELLMHSIDQVLSESGIAWHRYVDDYTLIAQTKAEAYKSLSTLSYALGDYGLTLNRSKTTLLSAKHYRDFVTSQLGTTGDDAGKLREIDLRFDPYTDQQSLEKTIEEYDELKAALKTLEIQAILDLELQKSQPDTFLIAQVGRTMKYLPAHTVLNICSTFLAPQNLHAFRASWSKIMRGIASVRCDDQYSVIFTQLDNWIDAVIAHSPHLLQPEANCLHFLRLLRFTRSDARAAFLKNLYSYTSSQTVRRACIDCWRIWRHRANFTQLRNNWGTMGAEEQRMLYLAAGQFGDEGEKFRQQVSDSLSEVWRTGTERKQGNTFTAIFKKWAENVDSESIS